MPKVNGTNISEAEFTSMQEKATAFICMRAFKDNVSFNKVEDIIKDKVTKDGLEEEFKYQGKKLLEFELPIKNKSTEGKWINTFFLQQKKLLAEFSDAKFTVFNREGGFMQFTIDLIRDKFGISRKDSWNPADIWLIKKPMVFREKIKKELEGPKGTQTIKELNAIMRSMFQKREVVGISLKLISGKQARYEEINVSEAFFKKLENMEGDFNFKVSKIVSKLGLKSKDQFSTQDTVIFLKDKTKDIAKFQIKGNTPSRLANLKFEGTEIGASAARLGKAPLNLVEELSKLYDKDLYNSKTKSYANYPSNSKEFKKREKEYKDMFKRISNKSVVKDIGVKNEKEFCKNMYAVFEGREPQIANQKLIQLYFIDKLLQLKEKEQNEYLTDLLFIAQKKGNKVFDFGPFGKLY